MESYRKMENYGKMENCVEKWRIIAKRIEDRRKEKQKKRETE